MVSSPPPGCTGEARSRRWRHAPCRLPRITGACGLPPNDRNLARGPVITWASRTRARLASSLAAAAALRRLPVPVLRVGVHPPDCRHPALVRSIETTLASPRVADAWRAMETCSERNWSRGGPASPPMSWRDGQKEETANYRPNPQPPATRAWARPERQAAHPVGILSDQRSTSTLASRMRPAPTPRS